MGVFVSRIMRDPEGLDKLLGASLVRLVGNIVAASVAIGWLFYLNWRLTSVVVSMLGVLGVGLTVGFFKVRSTFRNHWTINADLTARLAETLAGIRIVKAYGREKREELAFVQGSHRLFRNVVKEVTGVAAIVSGSLLVMGANGAVLVLLGGRALMDGSLTTGEMVQYLMVTGLVIAPIMEISLRCTEVAEGFRRLRPDSRDYEAAHGGRRECIARSAWRVQW